MNEMIQIEGLRLKFPGDKGLLFKDLSLTITKGEKVLILGPSGSGKSTFLQVLTDLIPGSIEVPVKFDRRMVPSSWGYVFQDPDTQFCMPYVDEEMAFVLENLLTPREQMPQLIQHYLQEVGLELQDIHTNIQSLSQGMKQRLAIASVLALKPEVLFLDEPTALLDPEGTEQVWETLKKVGKDKTIIIVEHKIDQILDFVDRIILFNNQGEMIADGTRDYIFREYRHQLIEYGIWYPNVWEDYISSPSYQQLRSKRLTQNSEAAPTIQLRDFQGYRGKNSKIQVSKNSLYPHEWICIVGENGAGKSTLLLALMQLIKTSGEYTIKSTPIEKIQNPGQHLGFVFQNPEFQFVTNSAAEEIAYTLNMNGEPSAHITEKVEELLSFFGLEEKKERHPYQLSIGQKRRLSVATALVKDQEFLLLDEPTYGQDARNTFALLELMEECRAKGTCILMVTHDLHVVEHFATRVWEIKEGRLVKDQTPEEYMQQLSSQDGQVRVLAHAHKQEELVCP